MKMKKLLLAMVVLMLVGTVNAFAIPVEFLISDLFDWGRLYNYNPVTNTWTPSIVNPYDSSLGHTMVAGTPGYANGTMEDSFGVGQVDQIQTLPSPGTLLFDKDIPGSGELTVFFWGFEDDLISPPFGSTALIGSKGGRAEIWFDPTPDYNPALGTGGRNIAGDPSYYQTVTDDGILVLDLIPVVQNDLNHTFTSSFDFNALTGGGTIYFGVSGLGAWDSVYNTNTELFGSDFLFSYTVRSNSGGGMQGNWIVRGAGRAEGDVIPEPTSMALLGLGLFGIARLRRRKA